MQRLTKLYLDQLNGLLFDTIDQLSANEPQFKETLKTILNDVRYYLFNSLESKEYTVFLIGLILGMKDGATIAMRC